MRGVYLVVFWIQTVVKICKTICLLHAVGMKMTGISLFLKSSFCASHLSLSFIIFFSPSSPFISFPIFFYSWRHITLFFLKSSFNQTRLFRVHSHGQYWCVWKRLRVLLTETKSMNICHPIPVCMPTIHPSLPFIFLSIFLIFWLVWEFLLKFTCAYISLVLSCPVGPNHCAVLSQSRPPFLPLCHPLKQV